MWRAAIKEVLTALPSFALAVVAMSGVALAVSKLTTWMETPNYLLKGDIKGEKPRHQFRLEDHWAGELPAEALQILDMWLYPEVFSEYESSLPRGSISLTNSLVDF